MTNRKATINGRLTPVVDCTITIPGTGPANANGGRDPGIIQLNNLPDISDSKSAVYNNEAIIGRSFPLYTYSHSADRSLSIQLHFFIIERGDGRKNLNYLRMIQSAVYPREGEGGAPYKPPPVCQIKCGKLLAEQSICAVLQSYSVKFPTEVAWEEETYCPFRFDVDTSWLVVYNSQDLPYQSRIVESGR